MTSKNDGRVYPVKELRSKYYNRIRTTGFMNKFPNAIVNLKLLSNLAAKTNLANRYADVIEEALNGLSCYTEKGFIALSRVEYMYTDNENCCVAGLKNGEELTLLDPLAPHSEAHPLVGSPLELVVSTSQLKKYFLTHRADFPYLNSFSDLIDAMIPHRGCLTRSAELNVLVMRCLEEEWVLDNLYYCLDELSDLLEEASFVLTQTKITKRTRR